MGRDPNLEISYEGLEDQSREPPGQEKTKKNDRPNSCTIDASRIRVGIGYIIAWG